MCSVILKRSCFNTPQPFLFLPIRGTVIQGWQEFWVSSSLKPSTNWECSVDRRLCVTKHTCVHRLCSDITWQHKPTAQQPLCTCALRLKTAFQQQASEKPFWWDILVVLSRHCKVKTKIVSPLYSVKSLCERFNKTIYSSHLVPIWRSSQKLRKKTQKNPTDFSQQSSKRSSYPHPRTEESKENEKVNLKHNYEIRSSLAKLG